MRPALSKEIDCASNHLTQSAKRLDWPNGRVGKFSV